MMGLAAGFYWCSFNALSLQFTALGTRDWFYSLNGVMGAIAGVVAPPVAGWLISAEDRWGGLSGYHWIFTLSLILFGCAALCTLKLHANARRGQLKMWSALQSLARRPWRMILFGCLIYGLREGVFLFLIGLLMYIATGSELKLGEFFLLQGVLSFASFFIVGRLVKPPTRLRYLGAGAICMAATALLFLLPISARLLMVYGAVISLVLPMFLVPLQGFVFDTISQLPDATTYRMEYIILREIFENIGRVTGIGVFIGLMTMSPTALAISRFAAALGFVQLFTWMLIAVGQRRVGRTPSGPAGKPLLQRATARVGR
ncbi:hypothetical protein GCM10025857_08300 [Alicyclobacillus contaminans]|nr:hypothetical protein GCM10025857_08300 [Alicyclobacillus contaminans]